MIEISDANEKPGKIADSLPGIELQLENIANFLDSSARDGNSLDLYVRADATIHEA